MERRGTKRKRTLTPKDIAKMRAERERGKRAQAPGVAPTSIIPTFRGFAGPTPGELKFGDYALSYNYTAGASTWIPIVEGMCITLLAQGAGASQRIGRRIFLKSILIRYLVSFAATSAGSGSMRFLMFYDKQANAAVPTVTDVLLSDSFLSPNNISNRDRFVTIADFYSDVISGGTGTQAYGTIYKKVRLDVAYNATTTATISAVSTGAVYIITAMSGGIITANPTSAIQARIRYTD